MLHTSAVKGCNVEIYVIVNLPNVSQGQAGQGIEQPGLVGCVCRGKKWSCSYKVIYY